MALDYTVKIFDQFYNLDLVVNASEYEIVYSFFKEYSSDDAVAKSFTDTLFRISNETQIAVLDLLTTFQNTGSDSEKIKISLTMAYYLNSLSNKTVLYGVNQVLVPNNNVQRNIIQ
jgi:hypothetical protein